MIQRYIILSNMTGFQTPIKNNTGEYCKSSDVEQLVIKIRGGNK